MDRRGARKWLALVFVAPAIVAACGAFDTTSENDPSDASVEASEAGTPDANTTDSSDAGPSDAEASDATVYREDFSEDLSSCKGFKPANMNGERIGDAGSTKPGACKACLSGTNGSIETSISTPGLGAGTYELVFATQVAPSTAAVVARIYLFDPSATLLVDNQTGIESPATWKTLAISATTDKSVGQVLVVFNIVGNADDCLYLDDIVVRHIP